MNKPNEPLRPAELFDDVREEITRRLKTFEADKNSALPAREALEAMLKHPPENVQP